MPHFFRIYEISPINKNNGTNIADYTIQRFPIIEKGETSLPLRYIMFFET